jgi:hypothetical protein
VKNSSDRTFAALVRLTMVALLLPTVMLVGRSKPNSSDQATASPIPVAVVSPGVESAEASNRRYPATIARDREANLSFRIGGVIDRLSLTLNVRFSALALDRWQFAQIIFSLLAAQARC